MKIKLDENFSPKLAKLFINAGFDTDTVLDEELSGADDAELYEKISKENRCMITLDLDFANIIRFPADSTEGIVVIRPNRPITLELLEYIAGQLIIELRKRSPQGCLWILEPTRLRIRKPAKE